ncbi:MAG: hypothetical protein JF630_06305, partial [Geodermatophilales bacterium]|nr:hypothetical protein [Geodermatophilales bacterium]
MTVQRSYENAEVGQQLYAILEAVKKPEVLWDKLTTGHYDWLGVRRNGRYVLGRPRLTPSHRCGTPACERCGSSSKANRRRISWWSGRCRGCSDPVQPTSPMLCGGLDTVFSVGRAARGRIGAGRPAA